MKLTVGNKLYLGFACVVLLMLISGVISVRNMHSINAATSKVTHVWLPGVESINRIDFLTQLLKTTDLSLMATTEPAAEQAYIQQVTQTAMQIDDQLTAYEPTISSEEEKQLFQDMKQQIGELMKIHGELVMAVNNGSKNGPKQKETLQKWDEVSKKMQELVSKLVELNHNGAQSASMDSERTYTSSLKFTWVMIILSLVISMGLAYYITKNIAGPVRRVSQALREMADGNLQVGDIEVSNRDEIGELVESLRITVSRMRTMILELQGAAAQVAASSQQLLAGADETAQGSRQIAASMKGVTESADTQLRSSEECSRGMDEMSGGIQRTAEASSTVAEMASEALRHAEDGQRYIEAAMGGMTAVREAMSVSSEGIRDLNSRSTEIAEVGRMISEIASQTDLLALNAAIEAARAGEQGRGFSVVASEVRKLSEQAGQFATQISELIRSVQQDIKHTAESMDTSMQRIGIGVEKVQAAGASFRELVSSSERVNQQICEVAAVAEEMSASSEQITASVTQMAYTASASSEQCQGVAATTKEQLAAMQDISQSAHSLGRTAEELQLAAGRFRT
ncbi:methyl-accepting chemotaxis protein [Paenibacillus cremeus]|nr:HAMP domain-containing methyl-accepting chemotaxis protein [Paenibacillus cremeus]